MKRSYKYFMGLILLALCISVSCTNDNDSQNSSSIDVTEFAPNEALSGEAVAITGSGFSNQARVFFNDSEVVDYVSRSNNTVVVRVPDNASSGRIGVIDGEKYGFSTKEFTFIMSAVIGGYSKDIAPVGETLIINGQNFFTVDTQDIIVKFGEAVAVVVAATTTAITVVVPEGAESGAISVQFGNIQTVSGPEFTVGTVAITVPDYLVNTKNYVAGGGTFSAKDENKIDGTKNGAYIIYSFTPETDGLYDITANISTNQSYNCYVNIDMGNDMDELASRQTNLSLTQQVMPLGGWNAWGDYSYGPFRLRAGNTYYLRIAYLADGTSWVANLTNLIIKYAEDQLAEGIDVDNAGGSDYVLYSNDFNTGVSLLPFLERAVGTNYVKVVHQYAEFYYDPQMMIEHPGERAYKGAEVSCDEYRTTSEGWYGYRFFLPEGKFPKNATASIITQIFNNGYGNTWAGHLHINNQTLAIGYRGSSAANAEIDADVCNLEWDKWIKLVINFRAGTGNKGHLRIWVGEEISESTPTLTLDNINFGFGSWSDSNTLSDSYLSCKFGPYVEDGFERTMRFDDLKALEGNPDGAFDIVKP